MGYPQNSKAENCVLLKYVEIKYDKTCKSPSHSNVHLHVNHLDLF